MRYLKVILNIAPDDPIFVGPIWTQVRLDAVLKRLTDLAHGLNKEFKLDRAKRPWLDFYEVAEPTGRVVDDMKLDEVEQFLRSHYSAGLLHTR